MARTFVKGAFSIEIDDTEVIKMIDSWEASSYKGFYAALEDAEKQAIKWMGLNVQTWEHRPRFTIEAVGGGTPSRINFSATGGGRALPTASITVSIVAEPATPYVFVDQGTRPHPIFPRGNYPLRFPWGGPGSYHAKTSPSHFGSQQASISGASMRFFRHVNHPGNAPRNFTEKVIGLIYRDWASIVAEAFRRIEPKWG